MVAVHSVEAGDVERHAAVRSKGEEEFADHFCLEGPDPFDGDIDIEDEVRPSGKVEDDAGEGFIHGAEEGAVAGDAALVSQGFGNRLPEAYPDVFDGVVVVDFKVAFGRELQVEAAVRSKERQHMVEETNARCAFEGSFSTEAYGQTYVRFLRRPCDGGFTH